MAEKKIKNDFQNEDTSKRHRLNEVLNFHEEINTKSINININIDKNTVQANI